MYVFMSHETSYKKVWVSMSEKEEHNHKIILWGVDIEKTIVFKELWLKRPDILKSW